MRSLLIPLPRCARLLTRRVFSSERNDDHISLGFPTLCIWGANTGVGKTLVSAGLAAAVTRAEVRLGKGGVCCMFVARCSMDPRGMQRWM